MGARSRLSVPMSWSTEKDIDVSRVSDSILRGPLAHLWPWSCHPSLLTSVPKEGKVMTSSTLQGQGEQLVHPPLANRVVTLCTPCMGQAAVEKNFDVESILSQ